MTMAPAHALALIWGQLEGPEAIFRGLHEQLISAAIAAKDSLWQGKNPTPEQVRENYTSPLKEREGYSTTLRCKVDPRSADAGARRGAKISLPDS